MRRAFVIGNWKMYTTAATARKLAEAVVAGAGEQDRVVVGLAPPFPYLGIVAEVVRGTKVLLIAQNCYPEKEGAFTGEVSPSMLLDVGCDGVIIGHSERRHKLGESNAFIGRKVSAALAAGLRVALCVGETLEQHEANHTEAVLEEQLAGSLSHVTATEMGRLVLAYEPVWAIGTGRNALPEQAQAVHAFIRRWLKWKFDENLANALPIAYGGSVKADNARALLEPPDVDGGLVGGASLNADSFLAIVRAVV